MRVNWHAGTAGVAILLSLAACSRQPDPIAGLSGPMESSTLPGPVAPTPVSAYAQGDHHALALLIRDPDSSWLGLAHGLKSLGVPFRATEEASEALEHEVILVYPSLTGANTPPELLRDLADHVRGGGTLIAFATFGGGLTGIFGYGETLERARLDSLRFDPDLGELDFLAEAEDLEIPLAPRDDPAAGMPGLAYSEPKHPPLARYGDGSAAIVHNFIDGPDGRGHAYAIGLDFGHYILRAQNGRLNNFSARYANSYQPAVDSLLRLLAQLYRQGESEAITLWPVPYNKRFTALVTHDVDYTRSMDNIADYASMETERGMPATYFIQTKYVTDWNDRYFFDASYEPLLREVAGAGLEIASHSVAHSNEFRAMPLGSGEERYPDYSPYVYAYDRVEGASIAGELRVSKFLLESLSGEAVRSFRPGHLSLPDSLPEMLASTGYEFSSSLSANVTLSHLPYRAMVGRGFASEAPIIEIPATVEDELWDLGDSLEPVSALARKLGEYGGVMNLLIHTDTTGDKLAFQRAFHARFEDEAWWGTVAEFGDWWLARESVELQLSVAGDGQRRVTISSAAPLAGLTLALPPGWRYLDGLAGSEQQGERLLLGALDGQVELRFRVIPP